MEADAVDAHAGVGCIASAIGVAGAGAAGFGAAAFAFPLTFGAFAFPFGGGEIFAFRAADDEESDRGEREREAQHHVSDLYVPCRTFTAMCKRALDGRECGMSETAKEESREHLRAPIELKVEYKKLNTFFSDYTKNISKGGTFIKTDRPLKIGTEFVFKLFVPQRGEPFVLRGSVAWIHSHDTPPPPSIQPVPERGMGIRFLYKDDEQKRAFESLVEDLIKDNLGDHVFKKLMERTR